MRALCALPGGIGRFLPCRIGANHCRLRHTGWEKCGHGLLNELFGAFWVSCQFWLFAVRRCVTL